MKPKVIHETVEAPVLVIPPGGTATDTAPKPASPYTTAAVTIILALLTSLTTLGVAFVTMRRTDAIAEQTKVIEVKVDGNLSRLAADVALANETIRGQAAQIDAMRAAQKDAQAVAMKPAEALKQ